MLEMQPMATPQPTISALTLAPKHDSVKGSLLNPTTVTESAHTQATSPTSTSTLMAVETVKHTMAPDHPALQQSTSSPARHGSLVENAPRRSPLTSTNPPGPPTLPCVDMGPSTEEQGMDINVAEILVSLRAPSSAQTSATRTNGAAVRMQMTYQPFPAVAPLVAGPQGMFYPAYLPNMQSHNVPPSSTHPRFYVAAHHPQLSTTAAYPYMYGFYPMASPLPRAGAPELASATREPERTKNVTRHAVPLDARHGEQAQWYLQQRLQQLQYQQQLEDSARQAPEVVGVQAMNPNDSLQHAPSHSDTLTSKSVPPVAVATTDDGPAIKDSAEAMHDVCSAGMGLAAPDDEDANATDEEMPPLPSHAILNDETPVQATTDTAAMASATTRDTDAESSSHVLAWRGKKVVLPTRQPSTRIKPPQRPSPFVPGISSDEDELDEDEDVDEDVFDSLHGEDADTGELAAAQQDAQDPAGAPRSPTPLASGSSTPGSSGGAVGKFSASSRLQRPRSTALHPMARKRHGNLPKSTTAVFKAWLMANLVNPYPPEPQKHAWASDLSLAVGQISNWFINARRRFIPTVDRSVPRTFHRISKRNPPPPRPVHPPPWPSKSAPLSLPPLAPGISLPSL